jgi:hypothetical protein
LLGLCKLLCHVLYLVSFFCSVLPVFTKNIVCFSRLPVRTPLFQCAVCSHGGHQACYREYYMRQPMVNLPNGRALSTSLILSQFIKIYYTEPYPYTVKYRLRPYRPPYRTVETQKKIIYGTVTVIPSPYLYRNYTAIHRIRYGVQP